MKIKKVFIKNFKGIKEKKIIDFKDETSLLIGPNGFGKTTLYDIIELCLTGKIHRTYEKENVTKHNSDYKKPFYQNTIKEDVIVKLWLEKDNSESLIVVKFLDKNHSGTANGRGRKNKPTEFGILQTFSEEKMNFEDDNFEPSKKREITQKDIDTFFHFEDNSFKIKNVYNLFNYLQQEETTYFLKKSEEERRSELGFLFQTSKEEEESKRIGDLYKELTEVNKSIEEKLKNIEVKSNIGDVSYYRLFHNKEIAFDKKDLFNIERQTEMELQRKKYIEEITKVKNFIENFSPTEFEKKKKQEYLDGIINNQEFIDYYVLQKLIEKSVYEELKRQVNLLNNKSNQKLFVLQKHISKYEDYQGHNNKISNYREYRKRIADENFLKKISNIEDIIQEIIPDKIAEYRSYHQRYEMLSKTLSENEQLIQNIINLRSNIKKEIERHNNHDFKEKECPYCGYDWKNLEELNRNFENKERELEKLLGDQSKSLLDLQKEIAINIINPVDNELMEYLNGNAMIEFGILNELEKLKSLDLKLVEDLNKIPELQIYMWKNLKTVADLEKSVNKVSELLKLNLRVEVPLFNKINNLYFREYDQEIQKLESILVKEKLDNYTIEISQETINDEYFKEKSNSLKSHLEMNKSHFKYNDKALDEENLYMYYFNNQSAEFKKLTSSDLDEKKQYIDYIFNLKQNIKVKNLSDKKEKIRKVLDKLRQVNKTYKEEIKTYKKEMVDNIKLPFYVYTAKMLQNYQQGMGVFLDTKKKSDSIRFLTDPSTDHDVMHHLSSGQLSVISLAFTLAINKTYNISDNLKFLTIDDPIQDMDTLNIHSFIELIRHEFLDDYQLILSTHSDINALYMKYKFEKMNAEKINIIHVQSELFN